MKQKRSGLSKLPWSTKCTKSWSCRKSLHIPRKKLISTNLRDRRKKVYALLNNGHRNAKTDQIQNDQIISPVPGCMFLEQVGWGTWLSNKTFNLKRFGSKMSSRAKSFHTSCLRKVWLKASWLFVIYFFAKTDPVWIISSQYRSAWVFLSGAQSSLRKSIVFRICQHRTNYTGGHNR